jgi:hypothetical protein
MALVAVYAADTAALVGGEVTADRPAFAELRLGAQVRPAKYRLGGAAAPPSSKTSASEIHVMDKADHRT